MTQWKRILVVGLMAIASQGALAAEGKKDMGWVGATGGIGLAFGGATTVSWRAGLTGGFFVMPQLSVGLLGLFNTQSLGVSGLASSSSTSIQLLAQAKYWIVAGLNVGVDVGPILSFANTTVLGVNTSTLSVPFAFGPNVGYDLKIMDMLSVGAEVDFLFNTASFGNPSLQALGNVKYRF